MPRRKKNDRYYDIAHPINQQVRDKLTKAVLEKYEDGIQDKWGNFIIEGKYSDPQIVYPAVLMVKSLDASIPK